MLAPEQIRRRALGRYVEFLRSLITGEDFFPLAVRFGKPSASEEFEKLRREITQLTEAQLGCHVEWVEVNSRKWGQQLLPERLAFKDEASYLETIGKAKEASRFRATLQKTRATCPSLVPFLIQRPLDAVEHAEVWDGLMEVCCYLQKNPRPNLYSRELPLCVDTKFVERNQPILTRLLRFALPPEAITEAERFEERFGLKMDEPVIRFRLLDETLELGIPLNDASIPVSHFRMLGWSGLRVVVAENKMTFLTLPHLPQTVGIWGAGNAAALLHGIPWLANCELIYWGDIDAQGFEILGRLRAAFPQTRSVMMDESTLARFQKLCGSGTISKVEAVSPLLAEELSAYQRVCSGNLRLEQERIPHVEAVKELQGLGGCSPCRAI